MAKIELAWRGSGPCGRHSPETRNTLKYGVPMGVSQVDGSGTGWLIANVGVGPVSLRKTGFYGFFGFKSFG